MRTNIEKRVYICVYVCMITSGAWGRFHVPTKFTSKYSTLKWHSLHSIRVWQIFIQLAGRYSFFIRIPEHMAPGFGYWMVGFPLPSQGIYVSVVECGALSAICAIFQKANET